MYRNLQTGVREPSPVYGSQPQKHVILTLDVIFPSHFNGLFPHLKLTTCLSFAGFGPEIICWCMNALTRTSNIFKDEVTPLREVWQVIFDFFSLSEGLWWWAFCECCHHCIFSLFFGTFIWGQVGGLRFYWSSIYKYIIFFSIKLSASQLY